jgi:uncharacterized protein YjlB
LYVTILKLNAMNRKRFLTLIGLSSLIFPKIAKSETMKPKLLFFKGDGEIPNSKYPLLLYKNVFSGRGGKGASWLEDKFEVNNWTGSWRNGIYSFHHFHSTAHEVLGIYSGKALVQLGGEEGEKVEVEAGDIIVIPAGVGHKNLGSENLGVVGAYPTGSRVDLMRGEKQEYKVAIKNISNVPIPESDPFLGKEQGLSKIWE